MTEQSIPVSVPDQGKSRLLIFCVGTAILIAVFTLVWLQSAKYEPLAVGKPAPDFSLTDLNDKPYRLSDFRGKVVFLNFWATWCKPCREEMPSMEILNKNFEKDGLIILAVSIVFLIVTAIAIVVSNQVASFANELPRHSRNIEEKVVALKRMTRGETLHRLSDLAERIDTRTDRQADAEAPRLGSTSAAGNPAKSIRDDSLLTLAGGRVGEEDRHRCQSHDRTIACRVFVGAATGGFARLHESRKRGACRVPDVEAARLGRA